MASKFIYLTLTTLVVVQTVRAASVICPKDPNCVCGGNIAIELDCNIDGHIVKINLLPEIYINIKCENSSEFDYGKLPKCANNGDTFKSVSFKDCPLPSSSFKDVLSNLGVSKTMALIFQNAKNLSGYFDRKHFAGLQDLTKLLLSINGVTHLPDNLFVDISKLTWLNIRSNSVNLSEELFKPLERLETLEISHNHMTNISSNLFSHLSFLRKLSLWQSNVTWFSKDFFSGVDVLEELDLSSNGLNELPTSIFKPLKKLKKLTLFSNKFSSLPQNLFKNNQDLETVVILNNDVKIRDLPKYLFGDLPNLKQIYIQRSGIENVPYDLFANSPAITNISLAYNDIQWLPEPIFNDQINLLELDLSYNKLNELESKLFSSLVRLERLNLCHNMLVHVSGSTFSSLLSLIYLNMEHNRLTTISSYMFSDNKQRMSISLAYNNLDFEEKIFKNNCWATKTISPFVNTYNLRLLNLSHNNFRITYKDWWINGHENIDVTYNRIKYLWDKDPAETSYENIVKKPSVWIGNNPLKCACQNYLFLDSLRDSKSKVKDLREFHCPRWEIQFCSFRPLVLSILVTFMIILYGTLTLVFMIYRHHIYQILKSRFGSISQQDDGENSHKVIIKYSEKDEEFVLTEVLPMLRIQKNLKIYTNPIKNSKNAEKFVNTLTSCVKDVYKYKTLVVFSPNYLTSTYSHVDIKKIHSEMLKAENTVHVFIDIGPENSIYTFLKDQRDGRMMLVWGEPNFWNKFLDMLIEQEQNFHVFPKMPEEFHKDHIYDAKVNLPMDISFSKFPDVPDFYNMNSLSQSQV